VSDRKSLILEEVVASETAQLLIDADDARQVATTLEDRDAAAKILRYASTLQQNANKWEQRLRWWNLLRRH
jgi:hypothetical protein